VPDFAASDSDVGVRLDTTLARRLGVSRAAAQRLIESRAVTVDGRAAAKGHVLRGGERVTYELPPARPATLTAEDVPYTLVYEDEALLVVDKPAGVVVHPAPGHEHGTLVQGLLGRGIAGGHESRPGVVHRLDRDTSGLLIVARTAEAHRRLVAQMARREITRSYVALLVGALPQDEGTIDAPLGRHVRDRKRISIHTTRPRRAVTHFRVRRRFPGYTLVDVRLETGRTHQIRVHFAALGYPVAGDTTYGGRGRRPAGLARQFLHAAHLELAHPLSGEPLSFDAPLPDDLAGFLAVLEGDVSAAPPDP
jgi:23S rRNA pseudouridine1911/1915/1917 synthase